MFFLLKRDGASLCGRYCRGHYCGVWPLAIGTGLEACKKAVVVGRLGIWFRFRLLLEVIEAKKAIDEPGELVLVMGVIGLGVLNGSLPCFLHPQSPRKLNKPRNRLQIIDGDAWRATRNIAVRNGDIVEYGQYELGTES